MNKLSSLLLNDNKNNDIFCNTVQNVVNVLRQFPFKSYKYTQIPQHLNKEDRFLRYHFLITLNNAAPPPRFTACQRSEIRRGEQLLVMDQHDRCGLSRPQPLC